MIVITGVGAVSPLGEEVGALFEALCRGESAITAMPGGRGPAGQIPGGPHLTSELALAAVRQATAGYPTPEALAVVGASTSGDMVIGEEAYRQELAGVAVDGERYLWRQLCHQPTRRVAAALGAGGIRLTTSTACTSGAGAIGLAAELIESGRAEAAVAFGADALCRLTRHGFEALSVYAATPCRPFDAHRDGMNLGEGAGALLLEDAGRALARGAAPLAILSGFAATADAHHLSTPDPAAAGAIAVIQAALGAFPAAQVGYVSAHGTGTPLNDAMEAAALSATLPRAAVGGIKGAIGHTLGAAGALEAIVAVQALTTGRLPPSVGLTEPAFDLDLIRTLRHTPISAALSVNFAFGGHNTALLLRRWEAP